jgi:hypothetical protein
MKLTLPRLVTAITFLAIFAMAMRVSVDTDTWWHLRTGQWIVEHRAVPTTDPFSHTRAGAAWLIPGWLVQVPMYALYAWLGFGGLNLFTAFFVTLAFVFIYRACVGHPLARAFTLVLAAAASAIYWSARPQIVSFALAAVFAYVLWLYRWRGVNRLWVLVPLMALWANAHGGFAIGLILIALTLAGQGLTLVGQWLNRRVEPEARVVQPAPGDLNWRGVGWLAGIGVACALAVMVNPAGPVMLLYPFKTVSIGVLQDFIQEWQSPNFHLPGAQPFLWLLFATGATVIASRRPANLTDLLLVGGVAYLGLVTWRNAALLAVVAPPVLTRHLVEGWNDFRERHPAWGRRLRLSTATPRGPMLMLNWILLVTVALAALGKAALAWPLAANEVVLAKSVPVAAADFVRRTHPAGNLFNAYNFGAYLTWALYPDYPVYVDGRTDLYNDAFLREYLDVTLGRPGYTATLEKYGVNLVLVEANSILGDRLSESAQWRQAYSDSVAAVYERVKP